MANLSASITRSTFNIIRKRLRLQKDMMQNNYEESLQRTCQIRCLALKFNSLCDITDTLNLAGLCNTPKGTQITIA